MPLIAAASSSCDICFNQFSEDRECHCIPCGHIFCRPCLEQLRQPQDKYACPLCRRKSRGNTCIRKIIVDWQPTGTQQFISPTGRGDTANDESDGQALQRRIVVEQARGTITFPRVLELQQEVDQFMAERQEDDYPTLLTLMATVYSLCEAQDMLDSLRTRKDELEEETRRLAHRQADMEYHMLDRRSETQRATQSQQIAEGMNKFLLDEIKALKEENQRLRQPPMAQVSFQHLRASSSQLPHTESTQHNPGVPRAPSTSVIEPSNSRVNRGTPHHGPTTRVPHHRYTPPAPQGFYPTPPRRTANWYIPPPYDPLIPSDNTTNGLHLCLTPPYTPQGAALPVTPITNTFSGGAAPPLDFPPPMPTAQVTIQRSSSNMIDVSRSTVSYETLYGKEMRARGLSRSELPEDHPRPPQ